MRQPLMHLPAQRRRKKGKKMKKAGVFNKMSFM
jgi:hypothetical protein